MHLFRGIVLGGLVVATCLSLAWAGGPSTSFDKPLRENHIPLPPNPDSPGSKPTLSCFYYPGLMVKQIDLGNLGAEQLSIFYLPLGSAEPLCIRDNAKGEMVIDPHTWSGYFEGVKGELVFFTADDGFNGGLSFGIFSAENGEKIFEDSVRVDKHKFGFEAIELLSDPKDKMEAALKLRYKRVYFAQCSLRSDGVNCWNSIKQITGLSESFPPNCAAAYEAEKKRLPAYADEVDSYSSVISYDVEVVVNWRNSVVRATPTSKAVECYIAD